ncbi:hypothetical protein AW736_19610 [Termitidicoccus mucosus]|uniref:Alpha-L-arabinofuranosidase C-terminal domain-containing protein n=1 Tax=Termitidicoccus mucosus TaxID=1184151 RepID=A0A178IFI7_9BACT|nr:hypothetical protein AW736_19610 [Opitutaceae bacterium TSB47]
MTQLERNGDIVRLTSYAPLRAKIGRTQWTPNLVYFTNTHVYPTINYHVQKLFGSNAGDTWLDTHAGNSGVADQVALSMVRDSKTGDLILKVVNPGDTVKGLRIKLGGAKNFIPGAVKTVLAGDPKAENTPGNPTPLLPVTTQIKISELFDCEAPARSLTVIRIKQMKNG